VLQALVEELGVSWQLLHRLGDGLGLLDGRCRRTAVRHHSFSPPNSPRIRTRVALSSRFSGSSLPASMNRRLERRSRWVSNRACTSAYMSFSRFDLKSGSLRISIGSCTSLCAEALPPGWALLSGAFAVTI